MAAGRRRLRATNAGGLAPPRRASCRKQGRLRAAKGGFAPQGEASRRKGRLRAALRRLRATTVQVNTGMVQAGASWD